MASARILLHSFTGSWLQREFYWAGIRLLSAIFLFWIFRQLRQIKSGASAGFSASWLIATGMFLAPILVGNNGLEGSDRCVFAITAFLVGLREELAYRGILQGLLTPRFGVLPSLLISNAAFVAYHYGIQPFTLHFALQVFLCGMILGFVYHRSGSPLLVVALHSIYDAIDSFTPFLTPPLPDFVCTLILLSTLAILLLVGIRTRPTPQNKHELSPHQN